MVSTRYVNARSGINSTIPSLIDERGFCHSSPQDKANLLASQFLRQFGTFRNSYSQPSQSQAQADVSTNSIPARSASQMESSLWFHKEHIYEILLKWPRSSSLFPDFIPLSFLKRILHHIAYPLEHIFNFSFITAEVPRRWKHAFVTPISKKSPLNDPRNYRPISITSVLARAFEKIVKKHILRHLEANKIISDNQFGFLPGRSVETSMLTSLNDWTEGIESKNRLDVVYFDFSKAFDRVPIPQLLCKMSMVGIHLW